MRVFKNVFKQIDTFSLNIIVLNVNAIIWVHEF